MLVSSVVNHSVWYIFVRYISIISNYISQSVIDKKNEGFFRQFKANKTKD